MAERSLESHERPGPVPPCRREQPAAAGRRALAGRPLEPLGIRLEPIEVILGFVEPFARNERFDEIGDESRQPRLEHLVLPCERDERREHAGRFGVSSERELEQPKRGRRKLLGRSAAGAAGNGERLRSGRARRILVPAVSVRKRPEGRCVGHQRLLSDLLRAERSIVGVCRGLGKAAAKALRLRKQDPDVGHRALVAHRFGGREHPLERSPSLRRAAPTTS